MYIKDMFKPNNICILRKVIYGFKQAPPRYDIQL